MNKKTGITFYNLDTPLYYSRFCLTDNINFAEFHVNKIPMLNYPFKDFEFNESNLMYVLDNEVFPKKDRKNIHFGIFYLDNSVYYYYFINKYKDPKFFWITSFLGREVKGYIGVVKDGKLIGLLITRRKK